MEANEERGGVVRGGGRFELTETKCLLRDSAMEA
jgi:hypothetical protein